MAQLQKNSNNRTEDQKRHDRTLAMMLHLQDFTYKEIAAIIQRETGRSISFRQVGYDLQHVREQWQDTRLDSYEKHINEELARLDSMEMELWKSWRQSQNDAVKTRVEKVLSEADADADPELIIAKVVETTEAGPGDISFLRLIIDVQRERRKLLGLYAPAKLDIREEHTLNIKGYYGVSPDDWPEPGDEQEMLDDGNTVEGEWSDAG